MTITAKVIADSVSPQGIRLTTMQLRYPKFIHGEFMTHRVFSRNASSSRAIPVERLIQDVMDDPAWPISWGTNKPGMQAGEELPEHDRLDAERDWINGRDAAVMWARQLARIGVHKQIVNRVIEPWCHINVVVTATEWANFYALRRHKDAQPEMKALADAMFAAHAESTPVALEPSTGWHVPYWRKDECSGILDPERWTIALKCSVARCARVSYLTHEGKQPDIADDLKLYERLVGSVPLHASPAEHQATPDEKGLQGSIHACYVDWKHSYQHGNFVGWRQYRKMLPDEAASDR